MAIREVVKWILKREAWLAKNTPEQSPLPFLISPDPDNADAALLLRSFEDICHRHEDPTRRRALGFLIVQIPWIFIPKCRALIQSR